MKGAVSNAAPFRCSSSKVPAKVNTASVRWSGSCFFEKIVLFSHEEASREGKHGK